MDTRYGKVKWGKNQPRVRTSAANWRQPIKWNKSGATGKLRRQRIFCASLSDWLDDEIPIELLADLMNLIYATPNLDWLLLTKRPENFVSRLSGVQFGTENADGNWIDCWLSGEPPKNVWIGTSVEDQVRANERIPELLKIPASVRFLSVEPMLGPINFNYSCLNGADSLTAMPGINLVIFGGESGPGARPCSVEWIRDGVRQCRAAGVAPFVKQLGADCRCDNANEFDWPDDAQLEAAGEAFASCRVRLRDKKGGDMSEWPEALRVREFPEVSR
jgi:protein gp37